ncbi:DUF397 domain-containing protein [Streptomyces sp. NPDC059761]|uniref:DUF397 domain-containing protein n=1 Tax=Streptomyces sp. NPDC059761 TaxID=3346937 RepID=UPI003667497B
MRYDFQAWHKSSFSGGSGENCVEQGFDTNWGVVGVRDTKLRDESPVLPVSAKAWTAFIDGVTQ